MTFESVHREFPIKTHGVYLNNASIGACSTRVTDAVTAFMADVRDHGRLHYPDWCDVADAEFKTRIARLIGARASEIAFVPNTTQGLSIVANGLDWRDGDNLIIADIEYPSNVYPWVNLHSQGVAVRWVAATDGRIGVDDVERLIDRRTRLISLSAVQFSNGFRLDLARLSEICERRHVRLNLDAIQWLGALQLDVSRYRIDFLSAGGHKWLLGPIGTGIFYCRTEAMDTLRPPTVGYHSVDKPLDHADYDLVFRPDAGRFEEALVNFPGLWGLDASVQMLLELTMPQIEDRILELTWRAVEGLKAKRYQVVSPLGPGERSGIVSFTHPSMAAAEVERRLREARIHVGVRRGAVRISPSFYNDADEMAAFVDALP